MFWNFRWSVKFRLARKLYTYFSSSSVYYFSIYVNISITFILLLKKFRISSKFFGTTDLHYYIFNCISRLISSSLFIFSFNFIYKCCRFSIRNSLYDFYYYSSCSCSPYSDYSTKYGFASSNKGVSDY